MCVCWLSLSVWVLVFFTLVCSFRGGLVNVSWQCFPLGEPGYTIIQCFSAHSKVQLCVWVLGLQTRESVFSHTAPALTGWPGCCLINHHISIHHCLVPGAPQTREDQEDTADTLKLSAKCLVACVLRARVCVCVCALHGQMAPAGLTVCEFSLEGSTCEEKQEEALSPELNGCCQRWCHPRPAEQ